MILIQAKRNQTKPNKHKTWIPWIYKLNISISENQNKPKKRQFLLTINPVNRIAYSFLTFHFRLIFYSNRIYLQFLSLHFISLISILFFNSKTLCRFGQFFFLQKWLVIVLILICKFLWLGALFFSSILEKCFIFSFIKIEMHQKSLYFTIGINLSFKWFHTWTLSVSLSVFFYFENCSRFVQLMTHTHTHSPTFYLANSLFYKPSVLNYKYSVIYVLDHIFYVDITFGVWFYCEQQYIKSKYIIIQFIFICIFTFLLSLKWKLASFVFWTVWFWYHILFCTNKFRGFFPLFRTYKYL